MRCSREGVSSPCVGHIVGVLATPWRINWRGETRGSRVVRRLHSDLVWKGVVAVQVRMRGLVWGPWLSGGGEGWRRGRRWTHTA